MWSFGWHWKTHSGWINTNVLWEFGILWVWGSIGRESRLKPADWLVGGGQKKAGISSVQSLSHVQLIANPWTAAHQASLSIANSQNLFKCMSIESVMPSNHLILCRPLLLPSIFPSIMVFSNESVLPIRWPKYWSFSFSISPSNEYSGLISFRIDWLDLTVQGILKSLLQHHSSKPSILQKHQSVVDVTGDGG